MLFAIGSKNPQKITAAKNAIKEYFNASDADFAAIGADSGVNSQPINSETEQGAINRAKAALGKANADFGIGIEGGLVELHKKDYCTACCAVISKSGEMHLAYAPLFEIPQKMLAKVKQRIELGGIMDERTGRKNTKQNEGALGIFSKGKITRGKAFEIAVMLAIMPFLNELYK